MRVKRKIVEINKELCNGCGLCAGACSEGAIQILNGKAQLVTEKYCDGLGMCIGECPNGAITIVEKDAEEFDAEAVEEYLKGKKSYETKMACGCPSSYVEEFTPDPQPMEGNASYPHTPTVSSLTHWPVQIRLIPPDAAFLKNSHLLVAADCSSVAAPNFHRDFLKGRVVMTGCPKFDPPDPYIQKLAQVFKINNIKGITALIMEVPCCQGLINVIKKAMELAGKGIPLERVVINTKGKIISKECV